MTREELIAYDKWLTRRKWGTGEIISPEKAADLYLAEHPLPPAEGAEEYLKLPQNDGKLKYCPAHFYPTLIQLMEEFATLHAQQIADKMVSERDDKLLQQRDELKEALAEQKRLYFSLFDEEVRCMYCEAKINRGSAIILCKECAENTEA